MDYNSYDSSYANDAVNQSNQGILAVLSIIGITYFIFSAVGIYKANKSVKGTNSWMSWIPFLQSYKFADLARVPLWCRFFYTLYVPLLIIIIRDIHVNIVSHDNTGLGFFELLNPDLSEQIIQTNILSHLILIFLLAIVYWYIKVIIVGRMSYLFNPQSYARATLIFLFGGVGLFNVWENEGKRNTQSIKIGMTTKFDMIQQQIYEEKSESSVD